MQIAAVDDLSVGEVMSFHYPGEHDPCVLIRTDEQTFLAYDQRCTHLACAVIPRPEKGDIYCPCHEGFFDLNTGAPTAGPPRRPLPRIALEIRNGIVHATGVEART
jgi:Rieske Fe-S protein